MHTVSGCSLVVSVALCGMLSGHLSVQLNSCIHNTTILQLSYDKLRLMKLENLAEIISSVDVANLALTTM